MLVCSFLTFFLALLTSDFSFTATSLLCSLLNLSPAPPISCISLSSLLLLAYLCPYHSDFSGWLLLPSFLSSTFHLLLFLYGLACSWHFLLFLGCISSSHTAVSLSISWWLSYLLTSLSPILTVRVGRIQRLYSCLEFSRLQFQLLDMATASCICLFRADRWLLTTFMEKATASPSSPCSSSWCLHMWLSSSLFFQSLSCSTPRSKAVLELSPRYRASLPLALQEIHQVLYTMLRLLQSPFLSPLLQTKHSSLRQFSPAQGLALWIRCFSISPDSSTILILISENLWMSCSASLNRVANSPLGVLGMKSTAAGGFSSLVVVGNFFLYLPACLLSSVLTFCISFFLFCLYQLVLANSFFLVLKPMVDFAALCSSWPSFFDFSSFLS